MTDSKRAAPSTPSAHLLTAALWGITTFAAVYLLQGALHLPGLIYDPAARIWLVAPAPTGVQMRFYSDLLGATLASLAIAGLRYRWKSPSPDTTVLLGSSLAVLALDLAFFLSRVLSALRA